MKNRIIADGGSIQRIPNIPDEIKALYKTVWEISQRTIIQMAADRGAFIDQSQSLNIHMKEPTMGKITSMHFAGWKLGLKTGMYYLRTMAASAPIQFTVDQEALKVADINVARVLNPKRKALASSPAPAGAPRPMYQAKTPNGAADSESLNGVPTPTATPPPQVNGAAKENPLDTKPIKADVEEGASPKVLAAEPNGKPAEEELTVPANKQNEDEGDESTTRESDIYSDAVLACSIENKEACVMCSG
jgi:ribonucleoside-diphosphate reductase subunit M1